LNPEGYCTGQLSDLLGKWVDKGSQTRPQTFSEEGEPVRNSLQPLLMLITLVQPVIRRLSNPLCPLGRIHLRTCRCKGFLLKFREEKYKREHGG
jgi:hypothetical protein